MQDNQFHHDACGVGLVFRPTASHSVIADALEALQNVEHRGACGADGESGDGAGILTAIPWQILAREGHPTSWIQAVGAVFLPQDETAYLHCKQETETFVHRNGLTVVGWREVPLRPDALGPAARSTCPRIEHLLLHAANDLDESELDERLMRIRKSLLNSLWDASNKLDDFYIASLSARTIVYKAMTTSSALRDFYVDLTDRDYVSKFCIFHRRFSTNTMPRWRLAQPFRLLGHNGEINTLAGNRKALLARTNERIVHTGGSDSANLDNLLEHLVCSGMSSEEALMQLIPEACDNETDPAVRAFYEYHAANQEPWDGPALIVYSDGHTAGAVLDKNGLRPARYTILSDGTFFLCSEAGALRMPPHLVTAKGRLGPGEMISIDLHTDTIKSDKEIKKRIASRFPYESWISSNRTELAPLSFAPHPVGALHCSALRFQLIAAGVGEEEHNLILRTAEEAKEPVFSMGDDAALAVLSNQPRPIYDYFKQRFAQVTNPPIDHLRESMVMSLATYLGPSLKCTTPILNDNELSTAGAHHPSTHTISLHRTQDLFASLEEISSDVIASVSAGATLIILSDRYLNKDHFTVPVLLAVGAVHNDLIKHRLRTKCSIIIDTAQCWNPHHFACLLGYGADAVAPYLIWQTLPDERARKRYRQAIQDSLSKTLSRMGITMLTSYIGGQLFEIIGLEPEVVARCFPGTPTHLNGRGFAELANDQLRFRSFAETNSALPNYGHLKTRKEGEFHGNNPELVKALHKAVQQNDADAFKTFSALVENRAPQAVRDLFAIKSDREPIPLEQVEPASEIVKRFCTGGMSLGALSKEAHETIAIAMNNLGAKSNSGEGGEDPARYRTNNASAIRQIASGRFGVTPEYIATAQQLEIKMAQGAKPGEGGQLPAHKVSDYIAQLRRSNPGVSLISPPPHHDIYSIEDLAQLIFDLRAVNPNAAISVKLVASAGIGTIAAGVAKAKADIIQISGHDGGTGAAPVSSIKHVGIPWEFGLADAHKTLIASQLRHQVLLRTDGGLRTGNDVIKAALLGADEYGFGTIALLSAGCIMARVCHTNNCPVGIATQREDLRAKFKATPNQIEQFFLHIAEEIRHLLSDLGYAGLSEIIGRTDLLRPRDGAVHRPYALNLEVAQTGQNTTIPPRGGAVHRPYAAHFEGAHKPQNTTIPVVGAVHCTVPSRPHRPLPTIDETLLAEPEIYKSITHHESVARSLDIRNTDRSVGARISGTIASLHGEHGFRGRIDLQFRGSAGQSFGAFNVDNLTLRLIGEANDYVGKGMNGGQIIIRPPSDYAHLPDQVIIGNACLYGATGGALFAAGRAGERFAVRNSAAVAVVEGTGDHACEYMTGGTIVILGTTGQNFGAGMTDGIAYIHDETNHLLAHVNLDMDKTITKLTNEDELWLRTLIETHAQLTRSHRAQHILANWTQQIQHFWRVSAAPRADFASRTQMQFNNQSA